MYRVVVLLLELLPTVLHGEGVHNIPTEGARFLAAEGVASVTAHAMAPKARRFSAQFHALSLRLVGLGLHLQVETGMQLMFSHVESQR